MIKFLVDSAKGINTSKINKEVQPMTKSKTQVEKTDVVEDVVVAPEADAVTEEVTEEVAKAEETETADVVKSEDVLAEDIAEAPVAEALEKVADAVADVSKSDEVVETTTEITNNLTSAFSDLVETVKSLQAEVEMLKSTKVDIDTAKYSFEAVAKDIASVSDEFNEFGKRVDAVEAETAFRKSGDLGEIYQSQSEMVEKSLWGGSFLKTADLFN